MYIDIKILDMARSQSNAIREKRELPYKAPYTYKDKDGITKEIESQWFDTFCAAMAEKPEYNNPNQKNLFILTLPTNGTADHYRANKTRQQKICLFL